MRSTAVPLFALILLAAPAASQNAPPPPTVTETPRPAAVKPTEVRGRVGRAVRLSAGSGEKPVRWELAGDGDLVPTGRTAIFVAERPGHYLVIVYSASGDQPGEAARVLVTIDAADPAPAPPAPPPPGPVPPPPPPAPDPTAEALRKAYDADRADPAAKAEAKANLAELYRQAAKLAADPAVPTAAELLRRVRAAGDSLAPDALKEVRRLVAADLAGVLPADPQAALTADHRTKAAAAFERLAKVLSAF